VLDMPERGSTPWRAAQRSMNETGIILEGRVYFQIGRETLEAGPSDAVHFDLVQRHRWRNRGPGPSRVLLLNANFTEVIDES
jgi:quercetin dioxygenase-like cupin family protein